MSVDNFLDVAAINLSIRLYVFFGKILSSSTKDLLEKVGKARKKKIQLKAKTTKRLSFKIHIKSSLNKITKSSPTSKATPIITKINKKIQH